MKLCAALPALSLVAALAVVPAACSSNQQPSPVSPRPAASVTALPGLTDDDSKADVAAYKETALRVVKVFIKDGTPRAKKEAMAARIAAMPEVEAYSFVSKAAALARFRERFGEKIVANLPVNPLPASFELLVRRRADVVRVAERCYHDPIVDNDPGTHNGIIRASNRRLKEGSPNP